MAVLGTNVLTYADWAKRVDDNYRIATIVELLSQTNEIMLDILMMEGNLPTGHKTTVRTGLPSATWRLLNYGVPNGKSTTAQIVDTCGLLETFNNIDEEIAELNGNTQAFRMSETMAFLEGMNQQMAATLIYGNTAVNPERFMGFAPRYNTVNTASAQTAYNVIDCGGTGSDNTSIWIVTWGANTVHGIFPKGSRAGLEHNPLPGKWPVLDANGNQYLAYKEQYKWKMGLTVRDWRYVVRLANIDVSDLATVNAANIINALIRGLRRLPTTPVSASNVQTSDAPSIQGSMGRTVIYGNRTVATYLDLQAMNKTNVLLQMEQYDGRPVTTFRKIPFRVVDAILNNEARVV
jgi:hypothetical protein